MASVGQGTAAGVAQHVRLGLEGQLGHFRDWFDHSIIPGEAGGREWRAALRFTSRRERGRRIPAGLLAYDSFLSTAR